MAGPSSNGQPARRRADPPLILGFDTSAAHCAAALLSGDRLLEERLEPMASGQSERLIPLLEEMLARVGVHWHDLSAIGVGTGPGNFTGIRIAVSAARGIALGLGIPAIGVTGFEALAEAAAQPGPASADGTEGPAPRYADDMPSPPPGLLVSLPAPRGQVWLSGPGLAEPLLTGVEALPDALRASRLDVAGAEAEALARLTGGRARPAPAPAAAIARIAARRRGGPEPRPAPHYLRPADAAPPADPPPRILP